MGKDLDDKYNDFREEATEREIQSRVDSGKSRSEATKEVTQEIVDADRKCDERERSTWGS